MKTKLKTFLNILKGSEAQRILMIALPCLTLIICTLIILPQLLTLKPEENAVTVVQAGETAASEAIQSSPISIPEPVSASLSVDVQGSELFITVCDETGTKITGSNFELSITDPSGNEFLYYTSQDGECHIVELDAGEHKIKMYPQFGYSNAEKNCVIGREIYFTRITDTESMDSSRTEMTEHGWKTENGKTYFIDSSGTPVTGFVRINEKLFYFNEWGEKAKALGVDVSYYNGSIDWEKVKADGIDFVIIRTGGRGWSSGIVYDDGTALNYILDAKKAGLDVGLYFYSTAISRDEAVSEAMAVLERLNGIELEYPIYIDMEYSGQYPGGRADTLSKSKRMDIANAFFNTIESCGYKAGLYSSQYYLNTAIDHWSLGSHSIWIANYIEGLTRPNFYGKYDIWQFTDRARISGIIGPVDMNIEF